MSFRDRFSGSLLHVCLASTCLLSAVVVATAPSALAAQVSDPEANDNRAKSERPSRKHSFYATMGWNFSGFTRSDLHLAGPGYDFTLNNIRAHDRPTGFSFNGYFNPTEFTIPQYNIRLGFYLADDFSISVGMDHMKYVMDGDQTVNITGSIEASASPDFAGVFSEEPIQVTEDFLQFEHTNGLNFLSVEGEFVETFWTSDSRKNFLSAIYGGGVGVVLPVTDVNLFGNRRNNETHLAGWGTATKAGLRIDLFGHIFIQNDLKGGHISLPDILVNGASSPARADQSFWYLEYYFVLGIPFHL